MRQIAFYHICAVNNWEQIVREQIGRVEQIHLDEMYFTILGASWQRASKLLPSCWKPLFIDDKITHYEMPTLDAMQDYCKSRQYGLVLYFHTKGVTRPDSEWSQRWRRYMEWQMFDNWRGCVQEIIGGASIAGCNWREYNKLWHFSGNFFWADSRYIVTLPSVYVRRNHPRHIRFNAEFWIGQGRGIAAEMDRFDLNNLIGETLELYRTIPQETFYYDIRTGDRTWKP